MKKFFFCVSLVLTGLMTSCIDKNEEVDANSKPSWLGESIYAELKNPSAHGLLSGTFKNYLQLIDDLGYAEVLNRTGSKTVFPANDDAFERFFASNDWGVKSYRDLSDVQKKLLLYSSMLDNALLVGMLPNVSNGTNEPDKGQAVRHQTTVEATDTLRFIPGSGSENVRPDQMPANNPYWKDYYANGLYTVSDHTNPMMVHLTREYMLNNSITTLGDQSDFAVLTGTPYADGNAYIFNVGVMKNPSTGRYISDVTCQNGYIHQMEDVIVPPGNMGEVLRNKDNTKYFSRIVDYFMAPYYNEEVTRNYHDWYQAQKDAGVDMTGVPNPERIYSMRYLSNRSALTKGEYKNLTPPGLTEKDNVKFPLNFDIGWNQYYPKPARETGVDNSITDMGAFFVPEDAAVEKYFLPGGEGAYFIDIYGDKENTKANLAENLDSLYSKNPQVLTSFTNNMLRNKFTETVPSKFDGLINDASENLGMKLDLISRKSDGKYDITIANNGVIYVLNSLIAPAEYQAVLAPSSVYPDMQVMNWCVQDGVTSTHQELGVDFKYYLLAMSATFAFFIPDDEAFDYYYLDPASMGHIKANTIDTPQPQVLHFYYDGKTLACDRHDYDIENGTIDPTAQKVSKISEVKSQLVDILNYHTLVLESGEEIGARKYYKTKHGAEVYIDGGNTEGTLVMSGLQKDRTFYCPSAKGNKGQRYDMSTFEAPKIETIYPENNGSAYRIDRVIQPTIESVYSVLKGTIVAGDTIFKDFLEACMGFNARTYLAWAGIKEKSDVTGMPSPQDAYKVFISDYPVDGTPSACLDYNVKMFNTYNYTLFAPDNAAMQQAYANGLPRWSDIEQLFKKYHPDEEIEYDGDEDDETTPSTDDETTESAEEEVSPEEAADKDRAYLMIQALRDFVRYHFVTNSLYADVPFNNDRYQTMSSDEKGIAREVRISGGTGTVTVTDAHNNTVTVSAAGTKLANKMTRDYWFNANKKDASAIATSSFCAVHQISEPLSNTESGRFDDEWRNGSSSTRAQKVYKHKKANKEL